MENPKITAILLAAGLGRRMGAEIPKQFLPLGGRPLLRHALEGFERSAMVTGIVLVLRGEDMEYCRRSVLDSHTLRKVRALVPGGAERHQSVHAGLQATDPEDEIVLVHDAVRPFVSEDLLARVVDAAVEYGAAVPGMPVRETTKVVRSGRIVETLDRSILQSAQTPQAFRRDLLLQAYGLVDPETVATDDATLVERLGHEVRVVEGESQNVKITTPQDLEWAEWFLSRREGGRTAPRRLRVGQGFDVHRLEKGRKLIIGGVHIPFESGLCGHSDADVLTHAIIDALLGASALGDIGRLFPDTDARYENISSLVLLERVRQLLDEMGAEIVNLDAVLVAQSPKLAPHREEIVGRLSRVLRLAPEVISLKATTTERLGFVGRQEGMAAQAVALIEM